MYTVDRGGLLDMRVLVRVSLVNTAGIMHSERLAYMYMHTYYPAVGVPTPELHGRASISRAGMGGRIYTAGYKGITHAHHTLMHTMVENTLLKWNSSNTTYNTHTLSPPEHSLTT